ncbi:MAG: hypothetical protein LWW75_00555 [Chlorobiales bacterium]|nr:hypothetical protein [Chlorobiales bacterium]
MLHPPRAERATTSGCSRVLASLFVARFGKGVQMVPRDAIITDFLDRSRLGKAFSFHHAMDTQGSMARPEIASLGLQVFNSCYRQLFLIIDGAYFYR